MLILIGLSLDPERPPLVVLGALLDIFSEYIDAVEEVLNLC